MHPTPRKWALLAAVATAMAGLPGSGAAVGDLELLSRSNVPPNVMLFLDNSGSMRGSIDGSTRIEVAGATLVDLINDVNPDNGSGVREQNVRFGLTRFPVGVSGNGAGLPGSPYWNGCVGGVVAGQITTGNDDALITDINTIVDQVLPTPDMVNADGTCLSEALVDIARYMTGGEGFSQYPSDLTADRTLPVWVEPNPRTFTTKTMEPICSGACPAPMDLECRQNFAIMITDGATVVDRHDHYGSPHATSESYTTFLNTIGNADGDQNECDPNEADPDQCIDDPEDGRDDGTTYSNMGSDWLDDVAQHLNDTDFKASLGGTQNIVTYTIGFDVDHILLEEAANQGGGTYFEADEGSELADALQSAIEDIFDQTQAAFSSAVVPGAQIGQGNALFNTFFVSSDAPVWDGHIEALRISPAGVIQDKNLNAAVDATTGELLATRVPFWDAADRIKTQTSRTLYTTLAGSRTSFDDTNIDAADLGVTVGEAPDYPNYPDSDIDTIGELEDAIVDYVHGKDAFDEDDDGDHTDMRDVVLGDVFHSEPRVIGAPTRLTITEPGYLDFHNAYKGRDRVLYVGANDGLLHAIDAGEVKTGDNPDTPEIEAGYYSYGIPDDAQGGDELWGYVPGHLLDKIKLLPRNSPRTDYFVDGPITVVDAWLGDGTGTDTTKSEAEWATVLLTGYREGGSGYLALDITDPGATSGDDHFPYPKLLWEFDDADLGESWSEAVITRVKLAATAGTTDKCGAVDGDGDCREQWVAIFGGGYIPEGDPNRSLYIEDPANASWDDTSKAIYMVALDTGAILAKVEFDATGTDGPAEMKYSIPSAPAALDLDFDGFADVVYIGDLGGQVWKWDIHALGDDTDADPLIDNWPAGVFFRTDPVTLTGGAKHYRSFFYPPVGSLLHGQLTLAFGSGERHDLSYPGDGAVADENRFYIAKDPTPFGTGALATTLGDSDLTDITNIDTDNNPLDGGFRFDLAEGEKFVTNATVFAGYVIVGSYSPSSTANLCQTASGQAFLHVFKLGTGQGFYEDPSDPPSEDRRTFVGGGLPSDPTVTVSDDPNDDTILIKTSEGPKVMTLDAPPRGDPAGSLIYWRQQL